MLCYETTDRNGLAGRDAGIEENRAFLAGGPTALTRGMVGAHASFTLSDESLDRLAGVVRDASSSLHVHVAEDRADVEDCRSPIRRRPRRAPPAARACSPEGPCSSTAST